MKHLRLFESFREEDIHAICKEYGINNYTINKDGSIDVDANVILCYKDFAKIPLKFRNVNGKFYCNNSQLESLEGCPEYLNGDFSCFANNLTTLEGCPETVGSNFDCSNNQLTTLKDAPKSVVGVFYCHSNQLTSLEGCPEFIGGHLFCTANKITTFEHLPLSIGGHFYCASNPIYEIWKLIDDYSKIELFNYYDIIRDDYIIILDRLKCFLDETNSYLYDWNKKAIKKAGYKFE